MRQIKFRVWSEGRKKWLNECMFDMEVKGAYDFSSDASMRYNYKTDVIVEQFTDIQDRKGNELCEGDICDVAGMGLGVVEICKYNGTQFKTLSGCDVPVIDCLAEHDDFEIVGNIHQNPELLEQNDE